MSTRSAVGAPVEEFLMGGHPFWRLILGVLYRRDLGHRVGASCPPPSAVEAPALAPAPALAHAPALPPAPARSPVA